jgi:hypothetical protein
VEKLFKKLLLFTTFSLNGYKTCSVVAQSLAIGFLAYLGTFIYTKNLIDSLLPSQAFF